MYESLSQIAQTFGLALFVAAFGLVLLYALWPGSRKRFAKAARMPLEDAGDELPDCCRAKPTGGADER